MEALSHTFCQAVRCRPRIKFMKNMVNDNIAIITSRLTKGENFAHSQVTRDISEVICMSPMTSNNGFVFPLYGYPDTHNPLTLLSLPFPVDSSGRSPNLFKEFIAALEGATALHFGWNRADLESAQSFSPEEVLHYVYAVLHAPTYRSRYAAFLKGDFPRIPLPQGAAYFRAMARLGEELTAQHLLTPGRVTPLSSFPQSGSNAVDAGYPKFSPDTNNPEVGKVMLSASQWFDGVPLEVYEFRVGGYQPAEKWLKDRRGRTLSLEDLEHYPHMLGAMSRTLELMEQVEAVYSGLEDAEKVLPSM